MLGCNVYEAETRPQAVKGTYFKILSGSQNPLKKTGRNLKSHMSRKKVEKKT
jgi:hypothetical protein